MASPQIQVAVSGALLTGLVRMLVPVGVPCLAPSPTGTAAGQRTFVTDLDITEVVALRADEREAWDPTMLAPFALNQLGKALGFATTAPRTIQFGGILLQGTATLPNVPRIFILASCTFRNFSSDELHQLGTSDQAQAWDLHRSPLDQASGAVLFSLEAVPLPSRNDAALELEFLGVLNANVVTTQPLFLQLIADMRTSFPKQSIPLNLSGLLTKLGATSGPVNIGVTAPPWAPLTGTGPQPGTPDPLALRIGFDVDSSLTTVSGWQDFYSRSGTWALDAIGPAMGDLAVVVDADLLQSEISAQVTRALTAAAEAAKSPKATGSTPLPPGMTFGTPRTTVGAPVPGGGKGIEIAVPVWESGLGVGDAIATLELSTRATTVGSFGSPATMLDVKQCVHFTWNVGTLIAVFVLVVLSAGLLAPVFVVNAAIITAVVELIGAAALGGMANVGAQGSLAGAGGLGAGSCGPVNSATGCRTCSSRSDIETPPGHLLMDMATVGTAGVALVWSLAPAPTRKAADLGVLVGSSWGNPAKPCEEVDRNPSKGILLANHGELPLKVCSVTQHIPPGTSTPSILRFKPSGWPLAVLEPGAGLAVHVVAQIEGSLYDETAPPPLLARIMTTAGCLEVDLNSPSPAHLQSEADNLAATRRTSFLCGVLTTAIHAGILRQTTFTDPIPFRSTDVLREVVAIRTGSADRIAFDAFDRAGRLIAHAYPTEAGTYLLTAEARAAEEEHTTVAVSATATHFAGGGAAHAVPVPPEPRADVEHRGFARILYRERARIPLDAPLVGTAQLGDRLVVLTRESLRTGIVSASTLGRWLTLPLAGAAAVAATDRTIVVSTAEHLLGFDAELGQRWAAGAGARAVAIRGGEVLAAEPDSIRTFRLSEAGLEAGARIELPGVEQLVAAGADEALALAEGSVWRLVGDSALPLDLAAVELTSVLGLPAARVGEDVVAFGPGGAVALDLLGGSWLAGLLEWPVLAVESQPGRALLVLHDRWETDLETDPVPGPD